MKRDKKLMHLLLLKVRDGKSPSELATYPESDQTYHAGLLVEDGLVRGEALPDNDGGYWTVAMDGLTSAGHDALDELESQMNSPKLTANEPPGLAIFISHSAKDAGLAEALVNLLRSGLGLTEKDIRCTSVNGYRFEVGSETDAQLKKEVKSSKAFIGLITPSSIRSAYVLFELGARWGANLHLAPVLAAGADTTFLRGPLAGLNALNATEEGQVFQLISDIAEKLDRRLSNPGLYSKAVREFASLASNVIDSGDATISKKSARLPPDSTLEKVLNIVAIEESVTSTNADLQQLLEQSDVSKYLEALVHIGLLNETHVYGHLPGNRSERRFNVSPRGKDYLRANS